MAIVLTDEERIQARSLELLLDNFDDSIGNQFRTKCDHLFREYRLFRRMKQAWIKADDRNDRDEVLRESELTWGSNIRVPVSYNIIETLVPIVVAQRPKMLYLPRDPQAEANLHNVKLLLDSQQQQIDFDLSLQQVARNGFIYGIAFGKTWWRTSYRTERRMKRLWRSYATGDPQYKLGSVVKRVDFDDPDFCCADPYDVAWHPYGHDVPSCKWMGHRLWFGLGDCLERIQSGVWNTPAAQRLTEDDLRAMGSKEKYDEAWNERMAASGFSTPQTLATVGLVGGERGEQVHEVWEVHTRERVLVILDRQVVVMDEEAPCPGDLPFQTFRPTPVDGQMIGISEIEPTEHLARELDLMRSMRMDAGVLALAGGYAFDSGMLDEEDLKFGPAVAIEVRGNPQQALMPLDVKAPPGTSFSEEQAIKSDINQTSGLPDALTGQATEGSGESTATGAQLVAATVTRRVELKSRRLEAEMIRGAARQFLRLDQRRILEARDVREPLPPNPDDPNAARWRWWQIGPGELMGEFEIVPEGGSTQARNVQQDAFQANALLSAFGNNPHVDQRRLLLRAMGLLGIDQPETMLSPGVTPVPPEVFMVLEQAGVPRDLIGWAVGQAQRVNPQLPAPNEQPGAQAA